MNKSLSIFSLSIVCCAPVLLAQSPALATRSYFSYGSGIGNGGFRVSTANGVTEVLVPCGANGFASGARYWSLHRYDAAHQTYQQSFTSSVYSEADPVMRTAVGDLLAAAGPELVFATKNGTIEIWNQATRIRSAVFSAGITDLRGMVVGDADGDGDLDVVVCSSTAVRALAVDGSTLWTVSGVGGEDLTIGQMDGDPALEVAVTSGRVIDCGTHAVQWYWLNGFGMDVECADIDGDGRNELIVAEAWNWIWSFDVDTQLPAWSIPVGDNDCIALANVDADPNIELLVGEGQWGDVKVYDTVTLLQEFFVNNAEHGVTSIATGDVDGDGQVEIVFGAGWTSTGPDYWYVADAATRAIEWTSPGLGTGFVGPQAGDVTGDGIPELVCMVPTLSYGGPHIMMFDQATMDLQYLSPSLTVPSGSSTVTDIKLADVDNDGDLEVFVVNGAITAYDWNGSGFSQLWQVSNGYSGPSFRTIEVVDLDGDGTLEVVAGGTQYAHVFSYGSTAELWHSFYLGGEVRDLVVANSDGNAGLEIHALSADGNIYIFDAATRVARAILQDGGVDRKSIHVAEGANVLIAGDNNGGVFAFLNSGSGYTALGPLPMATGPIHSLGWIGFVGMFWIGSGERIALHAGLSPFWYTANYGAGFGTNVSFDLPRGQFCAAGPFGVSMFRP